MVGAPINLGPGRKVRPPGVTARQAAEMDPQRDVDRAWMAVVRLSTRVALRRSLGEDTGPMEVQLTKARYDLAQLKQFRDEHYSQETQR